MRENGVADPKLRFELNVPGPYFVDQSCIDCDLCRVTAPECFRANEAEGHSYVHRQPANPTEEARCIEALENCPVEAIGQDASEAVRG